MIHRGFPPVILSVCSLLALAGAHSDEPPLTPVGPAVDRRSERVDPMRTVRMSAAERERLYEQAARDAEMLESQGRQLRRLTDLLRPAVVHIDATKPLSRPRSGKTTEDEAGSGVIAQIAGVTAVITNRHVVNRAALEDIAIRLDDGRELRPKRLWSDPGTDIAVLAIDADDLQPARLAEGDTLRIGDTVLAIGSPFGLSHSVTLGIVSAKG
ncbi:MAG: trypsin-like peptidase domain-containing protein, partial [Pirellulales bacterium]